MFLELALQGLTLKPKTLRRRADVAAAIVDDPLVGFPFYPAKSGSDHGGGRPLAPHPCSFSIIWVASAGLVR